MLLLTAMLVLGAADAHQASNSTATVRISAHVLDGSGRLAAIEAVRRLQEWYSRGSADSTRVPQAMPLFPGLVQIHIDSTKQGVTTVAVLFTAN